MSTQQAAPSEVKVLREGFLTKRGAIMKNWKRRYFVLTSDGLLKYYKIGQRPAVHEALPKPLGVIELCCRFDAFNREEVTEHVNWGPADRLTAFMLRTSVRDYFLLAANSSDRFGWMLVFKEIQKTITDNCLCDDCVHQRAQGSSGKFNLLFKRKAPPRPVSTATDRGDTDGSRDSANPACLAQHGDEEPSTGMPNADVPSDSATSKNSEKEQTSVRDRQESDSSCSEDEQPKSRLNYIGLDFSSVKPSSDVIGTEAPTKRTPYANVLFPVNPDNEGADGPTSEQEDNASVPVDPNDPSALIKKHKYMNVDVMQDTQGRKQFAVKPFEKIHHYNERSSSSSSSSSSKATGQGEKSQASGKDLIEENVHPADVDTTTDDDGSSSATSTPRASPAQQRKRVQQQQTQGMRAADAMSLDSRAAPTLPSDEELSSDDEEEEELLM